MEAKVLSNFHATLRWIGGLLFVWDTHPTFYDGFAECLSEALVRNGFQRASLMCRFDIADRIVRNEGGTVAYLHQFGITSSAHPNGGFQIPREVVGDSISVSRKTLWVIDYSNLARNSSGDAIEMQV